MLEAILATLEEPYEYRRLLRCGLTEYTPKTQLQAELVMAHKVANLADGADRAIMRRDRAIAKQAWFDKWVEACWIIVRRQMGVK